MSPILEGRKRILRFAGAAAALAALVACSDERSVLSGPLPPPLSNGVPSFSMIEGTVDDAGNVTFTPVADGTSRRVVPGFHASVYGTQNVNARVYTSQAKITTSRGTKTWEVPIGVRNLLPYPIGSNQAGAQPRDTSGIFIALIDGPTVTATSGSCGASCAVKLVGYAGTATFTGPNHPYLYWRERLAPVQQTAGADTVSARKILRFTSPTAVTNFRFALILGAAWPPPNQQLWSVYYNAATDSEPELHAEPAWKQEKSGFGSGTEAWSANTGLTTTGSSLNGLYLYRADSLAGPEPAYIEANFKISGKNPSTSDPLAVFGLSDGTRTAAIGVAKDRVGFVEETTSTFLWWQIESWDFIGTTYAIPNGDAMTSHTYRLRKFGTDSVTIELGGTRIASRSYAQLPSSFSVLPDESTTFFGAAGQASSTVIWSYVTYGLGQSQP